MMQIRKTLEFEGLSKISVINEMAAMSITASDDIKIEIQVEFFPQDDDTEDEVNSNIEHRLENGELEIELFEVEGVRRVTMTLPKDLPLSVKTENFPLSVSGFAAGLEVENENSPVNVSDQAGGCRIRNENGPVRISKIEGTIRIDTENGPVSAEDLSGDKIKLVSENAPVRLKRCCFVDVNVTGENGAIYYETLPVEDAKMDFANENGIVHLSLPVGFDFHLEAETEYGTLKSTVKAEITKEDDRIIVHSGEGNNQIRIKTENGAIKLSSEGGINLEFLKAKLEELKQALANSKTLEDKENIRNLAGNIIDYLSRGISSIDETLIREKMDYLREKVRHVLESIELKEAPEKLVENLNSVISEANNILQESLKHFRDIPKGEFHGKGFHHQFQGDFGKIFDADKFRKMFDPLKKMKHFHFGTEPKAEIGERSRIKILEMLETGKITAEEAERLLKAIGKE